MIEYSVFLVAIVHRVGGEVLDFFGSEGRSCLSTRYSTTFIGLVFRFLDGHSLTIRVIASVFFDKNKDNNKSNNNGVSFVTTHMAYFFRFQLKRLHTHSFNNGWNFSGSMLHFRRFWYCLFLGFRSGGLLVRTGRWPRPRRRQIRIVDVLVIVGT